MRPANRCRGGQTRTTSSYANGSKRTARWRGAAPDDAELEPPLGDELDDHPRVVHLERDPDGRVRALELAEELRHDDGRRAGRGADRQRSREVAVALRGDVVEHLLLEREQPLRAAVEARAGLGRLDAAARTGRAAGCRAASRARAPGARRPAG